jgi:CRP/FNR family transcriptional regulator, nitrogen oxide reductase regulator
MAAATLQPWLPAPKSLFASFQKDEIADILAAAGKRTFEPRHILTRTGEPATRLFVVKKGAVNFCRDTRDGQEVLLLRLSPGGVFGIGTVLPEPISYIGTAETLTECELYVWEHAWVHRFACTHPLFSLNALRIALEYIALYSERHLALVSDSAQHRLAHALTCLGSRVGRPHPSGVEVEIKNEHLASLADIGLFTASRYLKEWERKGAVEKSRGKVLIRCPEKLIAA